MAISDALEALAIPGRLVSNPTQPGLALAYPHGGTALGLTRSAALREINVRVPITAEEFGTEIVDYVDGGKSYIFAAILESWDNDAIQAIFPDATVGGSGVAGYDRPGTTRAGSLLSDRSLVLLFSPFDTVNHNAVVFYRALPIMEDPSEFPLQLATPFGLPLLFASIRNTSGNAVSVRPLADITL